MSNINELTAKLKAAAQDEIMCREACDTSDLWQDVASPENVLALTEALEDYKAAYEEEAREKEVQRSVIDDALCKLLPGCQYMDPPDGGSVTPLEQVRRMVTDYRERLKIAESRCDHRSKFWDVSGVQRCTLCDKAIYSDGDQQTAELVAAGIITKVGE